MQWEEKQEAGCPGCSGETVLQEGGDLLNPISLTSPWKEAQELTMEFNNLEITGDLDENSISGNRGEKGLNRKD